MMREYEYLFVCNLHGKLKEQIVGKVFCEVWNDKLHVKIESFGDIRYEVYLDNFAEKVLHGYSSDYAVYEITKQYKNFIMNRYFRKPKESQ